eukprot:GEMP01019295.1.p1 GENE.GEMP01019295.1~~GEMP01019295.1.p1  ORF type:complete len:440 (+),score=59.33 GEMP01019295.1:121-1440(+)
MAVPYLFSQEKLEFSFGRDVSTLSWRDGKWSNWIAKLGDKTYKLHTFNLAKASLFFESTMNFNQSQGTDKSETDLTEILPQACWSSFEQCLDFIYCDDQSSYQIDPASALYLFKIADILGISRLFEAAKCTIEFSFETWAPTFLEQCTRLGRDEGQQDQHLKIIRETSEKLLVTRFQPYFARPETRKPLLNLPEDVVAGILSEDDLATKNEDIVFDFVEKYTAIHPERTSLWSHVRWFYVTPACLEQACATTSLSEEATQALMQTPIRPELPPVGPHEIEFIFFHGDLGMVSHRNIGSLSMTESLIQGNSIRSQCKRVGDFVFRLLVFPAGTHTGVAIGSLSVFLEAAPQPDWPEDWEFPSVRYRISCYHFLTTSDKQIAKTKTDCWTFKANKIDRGWHDFIGPTELDNFMSPSGFVCLRGSISSESLSRVWLHRNSTS